MANSTASESAGKVRQRRKPDRRIRLTQPVTHDSPGVIVITQNGQSSAYTVSPIPVPSGRGFHVVKQAIVPVDPSHWERREVGRYNVLLDGIMSSCDCPAYTRWQRCKHRDGLQALVDAGKLRCSAEPEDPDPTQPKPVEPAQPPNREYVHEPIPGREDEHIYGPLGDENAEGFTAP